MSAAPRPRAVLPGDRPRRHEHQERRGGRRGPRALVGQHRDRGRARPGGRARPPGRGGPPRRGGERADLGRIAGVGLGSPGTMDIPAGMLLDPPNLPGWDNLPIRDSLAERLGKPTVLQNDGNAAAFGEYWTGAGKDARSLVMFTLGTGIGCGIVDRRPDPRGPAQPRGRVRPHHHPDGRTAGSAPAARRGISRPTPRPRRWSSGPTRPWIKTERPACCGSSTPRRSPAGRSPRRPRPATPWPIG